MLYESYDLPKNSPTAGLFIMPDDFIRFCKDVKGYTSKKLSFIDPESSRYADQLRETKGFGTYPVGVIDDIEIMFMHYTSREEAEEKWTRRCKRINWDLMVFKFNDQNGCEEKHVRAFSELPYKHKLFFTIRDWDVEKWDGYYKIKQDTPDRSILTSSEPIGRNHYIRLTKYFNSI